MRVAILAHEQFPDRAKTALGVLRYGDHDVVAVIDRETAGDRVSDHVPDVQDAPIVESMGAVDDLVGADERSGDRDSSVDRRPTVDALLIGIAPIGGGFDERWRPDVRAALERGCDVVSGLHYLLAEDEEFARLAAEHGGELRDVREPPDDIGVAEGVAAEVDAEVVCTVGTDCSVGKLTTTMELAAAGREAGYDVGVVPTGQTGIMIEDRGITVDRVISDFAAGAVESMIREVGDDHDYLLVEGQGSVVHPAYSAVTLSILHGAMPDQLVLCHAAGRDRIHGYESFATPPPARYVDLYESVAAPVRETEVVAGALNTAAIDDDREARRAVEGFGDGIDAPATDVLRFGADELLEAVFDA